MTLCSIPSTLFFLYLAAVHIKRLKKAIMLANGTSYTVEFLWGYTLANFNLLCYVCVCVCVRVCVSLCVWLQSQFTAAVSVPTANLLMMSLLALKNPSPHFPDDVTASF